MLSKSGFFHGKKKVSLLKRKFYSEGISHFYCLLAFLPSDNIVSQLDSSKPSSKKKKGSRLGELPGNLVDSDDEVVGPEEVLVS